MSDLLPPGNQPAPNAGDDPRQFPDFFASDMWPAMWPREIFTYANAAARDAELGGLGPSDSAFVWLLDSHELFAWTGSGWVTLTGKFHTFSGSLTSSGGGHVAIPHAFGVATVTGVITIMRSTGNPAVATITGLDASNITAQVYNPATGSTINSTAMTVSAVMWRTA